MGQRFSSRTGWDLAESAFAESIRHARSQGRNLIDLTASNPTACGFHYDAEAILAPLSDPRALLYDPDPRGMRLAREAVAAYYADHKSEVNPDALILTTSTSEGYGYLFRLLCNAGDEVLVAQPSYPLFEFLADLEDVRLQHYPLFYDYGWWIDFAELESRITLRTKAIVLVNPNNPTGHGTSLQERRRLEDLCLRHQLALIVDEVFLDYPLWGCPQTSESMEFLPERKTKSVILSEASRDLPREAQSKDLQFVTRNDGTAELDDKPLESFARGPHPVPTFVLSGLSKIAGLPQMKVGWIAAFGSEEDRQSALSRLEVIADTFLSMNAPAQFALPHWLAGRHQIQQQILQRAIANFTAIRTTGLESLRTDAGWSTVLRLPRVGISAQDLLEREGVIVHPGAFYGMAEAERIVISLIVPTDQFSQGVQRIKGLAG